MKKFVLVLLAACMLLSACALAEAEDGGLSYVLEKGELVLGLDASFPPMGYTDEDGEIVGFDIDLAQEVCDRLGVALVKQPIDWYSKEMELSGKNIDCIWNGMSITADRVESMNMSPAYLNNEIVMVVADKALAAKADFTGKVIGVQAGSYAEEILAADEALAAGIAEVLAFDDYLTALMDLQAGNLDGVLMDLVVANYRIAGMESADFSIVSGLGADLEEDIYADLYGIGFRKGEDSLSGKVWEILLEMKADGTLAAISEKWFGVDITIVE